MALPVARSSRFVLLSLAFLAAILIASPLPTARAVSPNVVISQVYGGGGNSGATYRNDVIELFNRGGSSVSLAGWSVQYASAAGTGNFGSSSTAAVTASNPPTAVSGIAVTPPLLWPPNHRMIDVGVAYVVTDNCGLFACRLSVASSELHPTEAGFARVTARIAAAR